MCQPYSCEKKIKKSLYSRSTYISLYQPELVDTIEVPLYSEMSKKMEELRNRHGLDALDLLAWKRLDRSRKVRLARCPFHNFSSSVHKIHDANDSTVDVTFRDAGDEKNGLRKLFDLNLYSFQGNGREAFLLCFTFQEMATSLCGAGKPRSYSRRPWIPDTRTHSPTHPHTLRNPDKTICCLPEETCTRKPPLGNCPEGRRNAGDLVKQ